MSLPVELLAAIDEACDRFEAAWAASGGDGPRCEAFANELPTDARHAGLRELYAIERQYRALHGDGGASWATGRPEIASLAASARDEAETLAGPSPSSLVPPSAGLRVRCPRCQQGVSLLADGPLDEISCGVCGSTFGLTSSSEHTSPESFRVGRFLLRERLGVGGFGAVWRARDPELDRDIALKVPKRGALSPHEQELFFREARAAAQLAHPGIVSIFEVGRDDAPEGSGSIYLVSELVDGQPLSDRMKGWRATPREAAAIIADTAEALDYAHNRGVIHRDLKPSNIMLDGFASGGETVTLAPEIGRPRLMDFGLAKRDTGEITMTVEGQVLGTPAYMSPEQARGQVRWVDRRTDIYSLGVMLFRLLTGELPFRGTATSQIQQRLLDDPPSPRRLDDSVPLDLATVCLKCLERDQNRRYDTAEQVAAEMRRYLAGEPVLARPLSPLGHATRWARRRPASAAAIGLGAFLAIAGPAAAIVIAARGQEINKRVGAQRETIADYEQRLTRLEGEKDRLAALATGARTTSLPSWKADALRALVADDARRLMTAARAKPVADAEGAAARIAAARVLLAAGREADAAALLDELRGAGLVGEQLAGQFSAIKDYAAKGGSESQADGRSMLAALAGAKKRLDALLAEDAPLDAQRLEEIASLIAAP